MIITQKDQDRFFSKVLMIPGGCHEWVGCLRRGGYGGFHLCGKTRRAHRVAFLIEYGREPEGLVCHTCDNPSCVNPQHLFEGTNADNMNDKFRRDRAGPSRLFRIQRQEIFDLYATGFYMQQELADQFRCSDTAVSDIVTGKTKHLLEAV